MNPTFPFSSPGIAVEQPFGRFIIAALPARVLLDTAYSDRLTATQQEDGTYLLTGSQRMLAEPRLKEIAKFIDTGAACFPNAIILAANYREEDGLEEEDEALQWSFTTDRNGEPGMLQIPKALKRAAIIDGQHRLFGFNYIANPQRLDMPLVCAVFFDLPKPYQARLFATINSTQRPVNKSQTYELFGYNVEEEPPKKWTPEKFAVYMARKLNADTGSAFHKHVVVPAENNFSTSLAAARNNDEWAVSMATVVEGIVRLISGNPKRDANDMAGKLRYEGHERSILNEGDLSKTPLRGLYRECNDEMIHTALINYFGGIEKALWENTTSSSFIKKTVGIQALFDLARPILFERVKQRDLRLSEFVAIFEQARCVDYTDSFFHASGASRTRIRKTLEYALGWSSPSKDDAKYTDYCRVLGR